MNQPQRLILASQSPRRTALLSQIGIAHEIVVPDIDESPQINELPEAYVGRISKNKAFKVKALIGNKDVIILAADTSVVLGASILGKPENQNHAMQMMQQLSGQTHRVITSTVVVRRDEVDIRQTTTHVGFHSISSKQITDYWATGEPNGKAGGYAIQGLGAVFVKKIEGSYTNVVGLPIDVVCQQLRAHGIEPWQQVK